MRNRLDRTFRQAGAAVERAHGGTLLLDEIGELPAGPQVKLLRVLQERQIRRVGGTDTVDVNVRLIAATNRSLAAMIRDGSFREDLYYRLDVFSIALPPLRQRRADLAPLARDILADLSARLGVPAPPLSRAALRRLAAHDWPGNVRELGNVLESALILGGGPHAVTATRSRQRARAALLRQRHLCCRGTHRHRRRLASHRRRDLRPERRARRLGLKPAIMQSKMKKLGVRRLDFIGPARRATPRA